MKTKTATKIFYLAKHCRWLPFLHKNFLRFLFLAVFTWVSSGCFLLLAGAGAGGAMLWQSGKLVSEENASMAKGVKAVETVFKAKGIALKNKVIRDNVTQLRGEDRADKKVAVDIFSRGKKNIRIEIRYDLGEESPARDILSAIKRKL